MGCSSSNFKENNNCIKSKGKINIFIKYYYNNVR